MPSPSHPIPRPYPALIIFIPLHILTSAPVQRRFLKDGLVSDACRTWGLHVSTRNPIPHGEFYLCANLPVSPVKRFDLWMVQNHAKRHPPERVTDEDAGGSTRRRGGTRWTLVGRGEGYGARHRHWEGELGVRLRPDQNRRLHTGDALGELSATPRVEVGSRRTAEVGRGPWRPGRRLSVIGLSPGAGL